MTDDTIVADAPAPEPSGPPSAQPRMSTGDKVRFVLRGIGQTLITAGLVVLLFVVYEVWITNIFAHEKQDKVHSAFDKQIVNGKDPLLPLPGTTNPVLPSGKGIANLYIPRLGSDYHFTIIEGDTIPTDAQLEQGPVHYKGTALPGQVGNFSVAGHRVGKGEPFLNLDQLRSSDAIIVQTGTYWYVYRVLGSPAGGNPQTDKITNSDGVPGREIVVPSAGRVLLPVPNDPNKKPTQRLITLTTCTPKFTASHRMIIHAYLAAKYAALPHSLTEPAAIKALRSNASS
jgi:sortase A